MSYICPAPDKSTTSEATLLTEINTLADSGAGEFIRKSGGVLVNATPGAGSFAFVDLSDVPAAYAGSGGFTVKVKADASGLEFVNVGAGGVPTTITVANEATDTECFPCFFTAATGDLGPKTVASLTFNSNTGNLGATLFNSLTLTSVAVGFTIAGGTTSKTLTVPLDASVSGTNTGDNAANSSSTYIGTTQVALNRASAALTLAGITLTTPDIGIPSAGTLTNCTGLPVSGLANGTDGQLIT